MDEEQPQITDTQLDRIEEKVDAINKTVTRMKLYYTITLSITIAVIVLPLIGLVFAIPMFMDTMSSFNSLDILDELQN